MAKLTEGKFKNSKPVASICNVAPIVNPPAARPSVTFNLPLGWHNHHIWGLKLPMCTLPYFVFLTTKQVPALHAFENFENFYQEFIQLFGIKDTAELKLLCSEINCHYYECNH